MNRQLVTRRVLARELAINAATRPLNIAIPVAVAAAAVALGTMWLVPIALVVYVAMAVATFFDADEAERVGRATYDAARPELPSGERKSVRLEPAIAARLKSARAVEARIREAAESTPAAGRDLADEAGRVLAGLEKLAERAQEIHDYLAEQDADSLRTRLRDLQESWSGDPRIDRANRELAAALEEQLHAIAELERELLRLNAQMEQANASLAAIHGHVVRMSATEDAIAQDNVITEARALRREVNLTADAARDAYEELSERR